MILDDDNDPKTGTPRPRNLERLSVPELEGYLRALDAEKTRVAAEITRKSAMKSAADALFRS